MEDMEDTLNDIKKIIEEWDDNDKNSADAIIEIRTIMARDGVMEFTK